MNIKLIALSSMLAASAVFAQEAVSAEEQNTPATEETVAEATEGQTAEEQPAEEQVAEPVQEPVQEEVPASSASMIALPEESSSSAAVEENAPVTSGEKFNVLHGNAYNNVGNEAAAATIGGNMAKPHEMYKSKLVYLEPTLDNAVVSFGSANTYFIGFDNSKSLGLLQLGFARSNFGLQLYTAIGKTWMDQDAEGSENSSFRVSKDDDVGAIFSMKLGALDLTANIDWLTTANELSTEETSNNYSQTDEADYWDVKGKVLVSNAPSAKDVAWSAGVTVLRHNLTEYYEEKNGNNTTEVESATFDSHIEIMPEFNIGAKILEAENARVFLGLNTTIPVMVFDDIEGSDYYYRQDHIGFGVFTQPNILAELALSDNWLTFGGASYTWNVFSMDALTEDNTDIQAMTMVSGAISVNAGVRFQYKNFALEASVLDSFYNNPLEGFGGDNFIANIGGFILF